MPGLMQIKCRAQPGWTRGCAPDGGCDTPAVRAPGAGGRGSCPPRSAPDPLLHHLVEQAVEHLVDPGPSVGAGLAVHVPPRRGPPAALRLRHLPLARVHLVPADGHHQVLPPELGALRHPMVQLVEGLPLPHVEHEDAALRVLVELVAHLERGGYAGRCLPSVFKGGTSTADSSLNPKKRAQHNGSICRRHRQTIDVRLKKPLIRTGSSTQCFQGRAGCLCL